MAQNKELSYLDSPNMRAYKLREIAGARLKDLFGQNIPEEVQTRFEEEISIITRRGHAIQYLVAETIASEAKKMSIPLWFAGNVGSSFVAFLCGITTISPLPEKYGGVDIPFESTGEKFGNKDLYLTVRTIEPFIVMVQGVLQEVFSDYYILSLATMMHPFAAEGYEAKFSFIPKEQNLQGLVVDTFKEGLRWRTRHSDDESYIPYIFLPAFTVSFMHVEELMDVYLSGEQFQELKMPLSSPEVIEEVWDHLRKADGMQHPYSSIPVQTLQDLVRYTCLRHGTDVIDEEGAEDLVSGKNSLSDIVTSRDDLFLLLVARGFERKKAFEISERVRKGRGLTKTIEADMLQHGVSDKVVQQCRDTKYLFLKAHAAESIKFHLWMAEIEKKSAVLHKEFNDRIKEQAPLVDYEEAGLTLIAGRPAMGKTSLALRIARDACVQQEKIVKYYSMEDAPFDKRTQRAFAGISDELFDLETHLLSVDEVIDDCRRTMSNRKGIGLIIVDYIQLAFGDPIESIHNLYTFSKTIDCPIIVISQLERSLEKREDKHPKEEDLPWDKENNTLFKQMMLIYRDSYYHALELDRDDPETWKTELIIRRGKEGKTEVVILYLDRDKMILEDTAS